MSNWQQAGGAIVGGIIGFFFMGGPAGAIKGAYWGYLAGSIIAPTPLPTARGPKLDDLKAQSSQIGEPIPMIFGTYQVAGNVIWASDLKETKNTDSAGGKGSPSQKQISFTYSQSFAILLCEAPLPGTAAMQGIRRIWANGKLIYDRSPGSTTARRLDVINSFDPQNAMEEAIQGAVRRRLAASDMLDQIMAVYDGTQTTADPTIESFEGVGNVPAFMDCGLVVFTDMQLADYGNRMPNLQFEVYTYGTPMDVPGLYSNEILLPWIERGGNDPRDGRGAYEFEYDGHVDSQFSVIQTYLPSSKDHIYGWSKYSLGSRDSVYPGPISFTYDEKVRAFIFTNVPGVTQIEPVNDASNAVNYCSSVVGLYGNGPFWQSGLKSDTSLAVLVSGIMQVRDDISDPYWTSLTTPNVSALCIAPRYDVKVWTNIESWIKRVPQPPLNPLDDPNAIPVPGSDDVVLIDGVLYLAQNWVYDSTHTYKVLAQYTQSGPADDVATVTQYPLNPCVRSGDATYNDQPYWEAAYDDAVAAGDMPGGLTYGVDYPKTQSWAYINTNGSNLIDVFPVPVADIVELLCKRSGLTDDQINVTDISSTVDGYAISAQMDGRAGIMPLAMYGLFAAYEADGKIIFTERGGASVETISAEDLAAHYVDSDRPSAVEVSRKQDVELPATIRVTYASAARDYQPGEQIVARQTTTAINSMDVQIPVSMSDTKALQLAEIYMFDAWTARNGYSFTLDHGHLARTATDVISLPVDGNLERVRLTAVDTSLPGVIKYESVRDDADVLVSYATRTTEDAETEDVPAELPLAGPTDLVLLELPGLRSTDNDAGYYAAGRGYLPTWSGWILMRSFDGGTEYANVATITDAATIGTLDTAFTGVDTSIDVTLVSGEFSAATTDQLDAGANMLAIGAHGRWELLQFDTASLTDGVWTLGLARRGLRGTSAYEATNLNGDRVVLMSGNGILRAPLPASLVGVEHLIKPVTLGTLIDDTTAVPFTSSGLSLQGGGITYDGDNNLVSDEIYRQVFGP